jgi:hypothetical protein
LGVGRVRVTASVFAFLKMINGCEWLCSEDVISIASNVAVAGNAAVPEVGRIVVLL